MRGLKNTQGYEVHESNNIIVHHRINKFIGVRTIGWNKRQKSQIYGKKFNQTNNQKRRNIYRYTH